MNIRALKTILFITLFTILTTVSAFAANIPKGNMGDKKFKANWSRNSYTITFNPNGGSVSQTSKIITSGSTYGTLPTPTKNGHKFDGWFTSATGGTQKTASTTVTITKNETLYAHWSANTYTVTYNANGGTVSSDNQTVTYGSSYGTMPIPVKDGYSFNGWHTALNGGTKKTASTTVNITANETLYAQWNKNTTTFTFGKDDTYANQMDPTVNHVTKIEVYEGDKLLNTYNKPNVNTKITCGTGDTVRFYGEKTGCWSFAPKYGLKKSPYFTEYCYFTVPPISSGLETSKLYIVEHDREWIEEYGEYMTRSILIFYGSTGWIKDKFNESNEDLYGFGPVSEPETRLKISEFREYATQNPQRGRNVSLGLKKVEVYSGSQLLRTYNSPTESTKIMCSKGNKIVLYHDKTIQWTISNAEKAATFYRDMYKTEGQSNAWSGKYGEHLGTMECCNFTVPDKGWGKLQIYYDNCRFEPNAYISSTNNYYDDILCPNMSWGWAKNISIKAGK